MRGAICVLVVVLHNWQVSGVDDLRTLRHALADVGTDVVFCKPGGLVGRLEGHIKDCKEARSEESKVKCAGEMPELLARLRQCGEYLETARRCRHIQNDDLITSCKEFLEKEWKELKQVDSPCSNMLRKQSVETQMQVCKDVDNMQGEEKDTCKHDLHNVFQEVFECSKIVHLDLKYLLKMLQMEKEEFVMSIKLFEDKGYKYCICKSKTQLEDVDKFIHDCTSAKLDEYTCKFRGYFKWEFLVEFVNDVGSRCMEFEEFVRSYSKHQIADLVHDLEKIRAKAPAEDRKCPSTVRSTADDVLARGKTAADEKKDGEWYRLEVLEVLWALQHECLLDGEDQVKVEAPGTQGEPKP